MIYQPNWGILENEKKHTVPVSQLCQDNRHNPHLSWESKNLWSPCPVLMSRNLVVKYLNKLPMRAKWVKELRTVPRTSGYFLKMHRDKQASVEIWRILSCIYLAWRLVRHWARTFTIEFRWGLWVFSVNWVVENYRCVRKLRKGSGDHLGWEHVQEEADYYTLEKSWGRLIQEEGAKKNPTRKYN